MNNFSFIQANTTGDAVDNLMNSKKSKCIAGGTNLIDLMKYRVENPETLVDINKLGFSEIRTLENGILRLGSTATNADTAYNSVVTDKYPVLRKAILSGASAQLRNQATNGGNLLQRTRCYYFYDTAMPCNKREPNSGCSAIKGFNRMHAILGTSEHCIAVHPSDMCVALAVLDAKINVEGKSGTRQIPILDFHRLPGDTPEIDTNLEADEVITSIDLPKESFSPHYEYLKVRDRPSYAFALVSVAAIIRMEDERIKEIRVALGGVAHKPWRKPEIEEQFIGEAANSENFELFAKRLLNSAKGFGHNDFKIKLAQKAIVRAFSNALKNH